MPYQSASQRRYFNAQRGKAVSAAVVDEYNSASKGQKNLPEHVSHDRKIKPVKNPPKYNR